MVQGKGSQKHRSMFKILIAYLARNRIWQNLPVIIAILANFCTHIKHWYVPSESLFSKHRFFFNGENWPILNPKKRKRKRKKSSQQHGQGNVLENFPKELPHFEEKTFLICQDFWRIWADL